MTTPAPDLDYTEAAAVLRVGEDWLRHETPRRFPHRKIAGKVYFSPEHIAAIRAMHEVNPAVTSGADMPRPRRRSA